MELQFQSSTRRSRPVLSVISLGLQVVRKNIAVFPQHEIKAALECWRYHHPVLQR